MTEALDADATYGAAQPNAPAEGDETHLRTLYGRYRALRWILAEQLAMRLDRSDDAALLSRLPELASDPDLLAEARAYRAGAAHASSTVDALLRELHVPRELAKDGLLVTRVGQLLMTFAKAFVELRQGVRAFQGSIDIGVSAPLDETQTEDALLVYLLDPKACDARQNELRASLDLLMRHQLALLQAVQAGARNLLGEVAAPLGRRPTLYERVRGACRELAAVHRPHARLMDLSEDATLGKLLLGRAFRRAYAAALADEAQAE